MNNHVCLPRMCLIQELFPDKPADEMDRMLERLLSTSKRNTRRQPEILRDVLNLLDDGDDKRHFGSLKQSLDDAFREEFVISRCGHARQHAEKATPVLIKELRPPVQGAWLVWQIKMGAFQSYYPRPIEAKKQQGKKKAKTHFSTSKTYDGQKGVTQLDALKHCVKFLWAHHKKQNGDTELYNLDIFPPWFKLSFARCGCCMSA